MSAGTGPAAAAIEVGSLVRHVNRADFGLGKVLDQVFDRVTVYFAGVAETKPGEALKTLGVDYVFLAEVQSDPWLDSLPPLSELRAQGGKTRVTLEQAKRQFTHQYPLLFSDPKYIGDAAAKTGERAYKWRHHQLFCDELGNGRGEKLLGEGKYEELTASMKRMTSINLLHTQEQIKIREAFDLSDGALRFYESLFRLLNASRIERALFEEYIETAKELQVIPGKRVVTWPSVTLIPYIAQPHRFMFLKPEVTKEAAVRLRFNLHYNAEPNWTTYESLLRMSELLMNELRPMGARDCIDVQSFIWLVADHE